MSEFSDKAVATNKSIPATYQEGLQAQFGQVNHRVEQVEHVTDGLRTEFATMQELVSEVQQEQQRQGEVLQVAGRHGTLTQANINSDDFNRPPNLEIVRITNPKYVSLASIENAIAPYMVTQKIPGNVWSVGEILRE